MKRVLMFSFVVALVLVASAAFATPQQFAGMLGEVSIGVDVPNNWNAVKNNTANTADNTVVPCVELTDKSDPNRWFWVFLAYAQNQNGEALTLRQVGNNMLTAYGNRNSRRVDDESNDGYYSFEYFNTNGVARRFVFMGTDYDSRIKAGYYLTYQYSYDALDTTEVNAIISSITIDGVSRNTGGGTGTGGQTGTNGGTGTGGNTGNNTGTVSSSSGGGCNSGSMTLFALLAGLALLRKK
ncbi:MAG: hypothetical protein II877_06475 [Synergistaceae bacterium]|nr:hypothetical protein [Synergistaceae bacterium]MBR0257936.1 hypothetical protein [Synergistaceae bacterium]